MCSSKCVRSLQRDRQRAFEGERAAIDELPDVLPFDVLHRDEVDAVDLVEIEDRADVWMIERGGETRLAFKALEVRFARRKLCGKNFDDECAAEFRIDGFIDGALSALAELLENFVIPQCRSDHL